MAEVHVTKLFPMQSYIEQIIIDLGTAAAALTTIDPAELVKVLVRTPEGDPLDVVAALEMAKKTLGDVQLIAQMEMGKQARMDGVYESV